MEKYSVKAIRNFNDYEGRKTEGDDFVFRKVGDEFDCSKERYLYLKDNDAVELIEIIPEKIEEEKKQSKKKTAKK